MKMSEFAKHVKELGNLIEAMKDAIIKDIEAGRVLDNADDNLVILNDMRRLIRAWSGLASVLHKTE
jgi:hypothetical protein